MAEQVALKLFMNGAKEKIKQIQLEDEAIEAIKTSCGFSLKLDKFVNNIPL